MRALCRAEWGRGIRAFGPRRAAGTTDRSFGGAGLNAFGERRGQAKRRWEGRGMARERARRTLGPARAISPALFSSSPREPARVLIATFASVVENRGSADFGARSSNPRGAAKGNPVSINIRYLDRREFPFRLRIFRFPFAFPDEFARRVGFARSCHGRLLPPSAFLSFPSVARRAFASRARTARDARRLTRTRRRHIARERHARASSARETSRLTWSRRSSASSRTAPRQLSEIPTVPGRRPPWCRRCRARASGFRLPDHDGRQGERLRPRARR